MLQTEQIRIRCSPETRKKWMAHVAKFGLKKSEDALLYFLDNPAFTLEPDVGKKVF